jgi:hypothetical protein
MVTTGSPADWIKRVSGKFDLMATALIDSDVANARSSPQIGPRGPDLLLPRPWETFIGNADLNKLKELFVIPNFRGKMSFT